MIYPFYGNAADFRTYCATMGITLPGEATDDDQVNQWLLNASIWIDGVYRDQFGGVKVGLRPQVREWPRNSAVDIDGYPIDYQTIPQEILDGTYEAASYLANGTILSVNYTPSKYSEVNIAGAISVKYNETDANSVQTQFIKVDRILQPILTNNGDGGDYSMLSGGAARA